MPTNDKNYMRNYMRAYRKSPRKLSEHASRMRALRSMGREGVQDGREVDHKDSNAMNNGKGNLRVVNRRTNRVRGANKANKKRMK